MKKLYRGPYIDAFCQVWFHLVQLFQRSRLKYEKLTDGRRKTDDGRRTPSDGNTSPDQKKRYIFYLPRTYTSLYLLLSEKRRYIYLVRVTFFISFCAICCASFGFKFNPIWPGWKRLRIKLYFTLGYSRIFYGRWSLKHCVRIFFINKKIRKERQYLRKRRRRNFRRWRRTRWLANTLLKTSRTKQ